MIYNDFNVCWNYVKLSIGTAAICHCGNEANFFLAVAFQGLWAVKRIIRGQAIGFVSKILNADWRAG